MLFAKKHIRPDSLTQNSMISMIRPPGSRPKVIESRDRANQGWDRVGYPAIVI
jgi:hypothetical protein